MKRSKSTNPTTPRPPENDPLAPDTKGVFEDETGTLFCYGETRYEWLTAEIPDSLQNTQ